MKKNGNYKFIVVAITDILKNGSYFIFTSSGKDIIEAGYAIQNIKQGMYIDGQVSRKKQIVPALINGINRLKWFCFNNKIMRKCNALFLFFLNDYIISIYVCDFH